MGKHRVWYLTTEYGTVFWNAEGFIHYIHENDMLYSEEYFKPVLDYLNVEINYYEGHEEDNYAIPDWVEKYVAKMET